jgi:hypothetical protein
MPPSACADSVEGTDDHYARCALDELVATADELYSAPADDADVDEIVTRLAMFARLTMGKSADGEVGNPALSGLTARLRSLTQHLERAVLAHPAVDSVALKACRRGDGPHRGLERAPGWSWIAATSSK